MLLSAAAIIIGLILLVWSADRFVDGASATAYHFGMPTLLIGILIVGFGTSAPEIVVSILSAIEGSPGLALGNAYGSNIANIALILGVTALISPISVNSQVIRKELPILMLVTAFSALIIWDLEVSRFEGISLLLVFSIFIGWSLWQAKKSSSDAMDAEVEAELKDHQMPIHKAIMWLSLGLLLLVVSSRILVWGAVRVATDFGVSELVIGLTVVAIGTSLPELASSIAATRKGEHDLAIGNVVGSNMFNTLAVVGIAATIEPMATEASVLYRDMSVMCALTFGLFVLAYGFRGKGRLNRVEGALLLSAYVAYNIWIGYSLAAS